MASPLSLDGQVALVTGATRGIGWETARILAEHGADVVVSGRAGGAAVADRAAALGKEFGRNCLGIAFDVADPAAVQDAYQQIFKTYKRLDILVNNAGVMHDGLLGMTPTATIEETFRTNALGVLYNMQEAVRLMARRKSGSIVNVSSLIGVSGNEGQVAYAGSKAAVIGMTRAAAKELAPKGIRVNAVAPGMIDTELLSGLTEARRQARIASIGMGRIGAPTDVANTILFLASGLSSYVTGQVLGVDGGMII
jgi:3-oxoacyl-[acyl-carrier protein] reductase